MEITLAMSMEAYAKAKGVFDGKIEREEALDALTQQYGMNRNSAVDYISNFKYMMEGKKYTRTINTDATDYYLHHIFSDYGHARLRDALKAVDKHIEYYGSLGRGNLQSIRLVYEKYADILSNSDALYPDEVASAEVLTEGAKKQVIVNAFERNPKARRECLSHHGTCCHVCALDFAHTYGDIGIGFIHVHHLKQLAAIGDKYRVDPIVDLRPVCPNCHAMLHRRTPPYTISELRSRIGHLRR